MIQKLLFFLVSAHALSAAAMTPDKAYGVLMDGNMRFRMDKTEHPNRSAERRLETAGKQTPFATIIGCADSRVATEILFDQGIGDLFVVRVAGNVVGPIELESVKFSTAALGSSLVMVLGHQSCGAVKAVLDGTTETIPEIAALIEPGIKRLSRSGNRLKNGIIANVRNMVNELKKKPALKAQLDEGKIKICGGYYNFETGEVEIVSEP